MPNEKSLYSNLMEKGKPHPYRCQMHKMWLKKGQCEVCRLNADLKLKEQEALTGSNKPEIKIGKI